MSVPTPIYLDAAATTALAPEALAAMAEVFSAGPANPSSQHRAGRLARQRLEDAAEQIGLALGARLTTHHPDRVVFTSGGTEANNLAIHALAGRQPTRLLVSSVEHPSIRGTVDELSRRGWQIDRIAVDPAGRVDLAHFDSLLDAAKPQPSGVSVMLVNNETGVLQPVAEIAARCSARQIPLHTDAVQAIGKVPFSFTALGVSMATIAAHKFHGPAGIGALILRSGCACPPLLFGGSQQLGTRPGTEPVALAVGMQVALLPRIHDLDRRAAQLKMLRDRLESQLIDLAGAVRNGAGDRAAHLANLSFPGVDRQSLLMALDLVGIQASTGSACASGSSEPSYVLQSMGCEPARIESSLRLAVNESTTGEEVEEAIERISRTVARLRA